MLTSNEILEKNDVKPYTGDERILTSKILTDCGTAFARKGHILEVNLWGPLY